MDSVQDVYDFFQSNYNAYRSGPLFKLFRVIDLKLSVFLRSIFRSSLTSWEELVDRYCKPKSNQIPGQKDMQSSSASRKPSMMSSNRRLSGFGGNSLGLGNSRTNMSKNALRESFR